MVLKTALKMVVTLTISLEHVVLCSGFFWKDFSKFTTSFLDNVKDSEWDMKRDKICDFGFSTTTNLETEERKILSFIINSNLLA